MLRHAAALLALLRVQTTAAPPAPDDAAVRAAAAHVFTGRAYDRSLRETLWDRFLQWAADLIDRFGHTDRAAGWRWTALVLLGVIAIAVIARIVYLARSGDSARAGAAA